MVTGWGEEKHRKRDNNITRCVIYAGREARHLSAVCQEAGDAAREKVTPNA